MQRAERTTSLWGLLAAPATEPPLQNTAQAHHSPGSYCTVLQLPRPPDSIPRDGLQVLFYLAAPRPRRLLDLSASPRATSGSRLLPGTCESFMLVKQKDRF